MPSYNNYFPVGYQPGSYPLPYQQPTVAQPNVTTTSINPVQSSSIVWVQGEAGAKAYPVAAGNSMLLMDSENEQFYIKSTDISGMPMPLRVFSYKETVANKEKAPATIDLDMSMYITRDELESRLNALKMPLNKKSKKEELENEQLI